MFTWQAAVVAASVVSLPIMIRTARSAIESVDPEMIDSSTMLGYSWAETPFHVVLPLAWQGILAGVVLTFTRAIGEFGATLMLAGNIPGRTATMPLAIYGSAAAGSFPKRKPSRKPAGSSGGSVWKAWRAPCRKASPGDRSSGRPLPGP